MSARNSKLPESAQMFLATLDGLTRDEALMNVALEAKLSRWSTLTARTVRLAVLTRYMRGVS